MKYNKNKFSHMVPSITDSAVPCFIKKGIAARKCGGIDTIGNLWSWIMRWRPLKKMLNDWKHYGDYYFVDTRPFTVQSSIVPANEKIADAAGLYVPH